MGQSIEEWNKFVGDRQIFFKGGLPHGLLGPFLNTLSQIIMSIFLALILFAILFTDKSTYE